MAAEEEEAPPTALWEGPINDDGLPHGKGKMTYPPPPLREDEEEPDSERLGDSFAGDMVKGKREGSGTYTWANGATYTGEYKNNKKHGKGKMVFADKGVYEGEWANDEMCGAGTFVYANKDMYQGRWEASKRDGAGTYFFRDSGCLMVGEWKAGGFMHGKWVHADGTIFYGDFRGRTVDGAIDPAKGAYYFPSAGLLQPGAFGRGGAWSPTEPPSVAPVSALEAKAGVTPPVREVTAPEWADGVGTVETLTATASKLDLAAMSVAEIEQLCLQLFLSADEDGNGHLDREEFSRILKSAQLGLGSYEIREILAEADEDENGVISYTEFLPTMVQLLPAIRAAAKAKEEAEAVRKEAEVLFHGMDKEELRAALEWTFMAADADGNGVLSRAEFKECLKSSNLGLTRRDVNLLLSSVDVNHDGKISYQEFLPLCIELLLQSLQDDLLTERAVALTGKVPRMLLDAFEQADTNYEGLLHRAVVLEVLEELSFSNMLGLTSLQLLTLMGAAPKGPKIDYTKFVAIIAPMIQSMRANFHKSRQVEIVRALMPEPSSVAGEVDTAALRAALEAEFAKVETHELGYYEEAAAVKVLTDLPKAAPSLGLTEEIKEMMLMSLRIHGMIKHGRLSENKKQQVLGYITDSIQLMQSTAYLDKKAAAS